MPSGLTESETSKIGSLITSNSTGHIDAPDVELKSNGHDSILNRGDGEQPRVRLLNYMTLCFIFILVTGYYIVSMILTPQDHLIRTILYIFIVTKLILKMIPLSIITSPIGIMIRPVVQIMSKIPRLFACTTWIVILIVILLSVTFGTPVVNSSTIYERCQSLLGLLVFIGIMIATSKVSFMLFI